MEHVFCWFFLENLSPSNNKACALANTTKSTALRYLWCIAYELSKSPCYYILTECPSLWQLECAWRESLDITETPGVVVVACVHPVYHEVAAIHLYRKNKGVKRLYSPSSPCDLSDGDVGQVLPPLNCPRLHAVCLLCPIWFNGNLSQPYLYSSMCWYEARVWWNRKLFYLFLNIILGLNQNGPKFFVNPQEWGRS